MVAISAAEILTWRPSSDSDSDFVGRILVDSVFKPRFHDCRKLCRHQRLGSPWTSAGGMAQAKALIKRAKQKFAGQYFFRNENTFGECEGQFSVEGNCLSFVGAL